MTDDITPAVIDALDAGTPAVRAFREAKGESATGLARGAGIPADRLAAIEAGATPTSFETTAIATALGIEVQDLVNALE